MRGELFHPAEVATILRKLKRGEGGTSTPVAEAGGFSAITHYLSSEHNIHDVKGPEDVPSYIARDDAGKINLYGTPLEEDPFVRQATDERGAIHTIWAPEIIKSHS